MRCLHALALALILSAAGGAEAQPAPGPPLPDPSGLWKAVHPREDWGEVLVQFHPLTGTVSMEAVEWPRYRVSIWKRTATGLRKLRDGLFGDRVMAALIIRDGALAMAWYADDPSRASFDAVERLEPGLVLEFASGEAFAWDGAPVPPPPELLPLPALAGVYSFEHEAIGTVHLLLEPLADGGSSVRVVHELPGLGWTLSGEGLFGGERPGDGFTRVEAGFSGGRPVLLWSNPLSPGRTRTDRVSTVYPDGDIGLAPAGGESRFLEGSVLERVAGPEARVGRPSGFLDFGGLYRYRVAGETGSVLVLARLDGTAADGSPAWSLDRVRVEGDRLVSEGRGVSERDIFTRVQVEEGGGRCFLRFIAPEAGFEETLEAVEMLPDGSFSLRSLAPPVVRAPAGRPGAPGEEEPPLVASLERAEPALSALVPALLRTAGASGSATVAGGGSAAGSREAAIARALAAWGALPAADRRAWMSFSGWKPSIAGTSGPANLDRDGFAMPGGMESPAAEFAAFAAECLCAPPYKDTGSRAAWRLPDRYRFVRSRFPELAAAPLAFGNRPGAAAWVDPREVEAVELLITTPASSSVASVAGHALLLIRRKGDREDAMDSLVLGFVGLTALDRAGGVDEFTYAWRGITGRYRSTLAEETLESLARRANLVENRDVLRFSLRLTPEETGRLVERLWVLSRAWSAEYRFFSDNCASMLLEALAAACPDDPALRPADPVMAPMLVLGTLAAAGRIGGFVQPDFPSPGARARRSGELNGDLARRMVELAPLELKAPLAAALDRALRGAGSTVEETTLFREPRLAASAGGRAEAYGEIAALCLQACAGPGGERAWPLAESTLRWLYNAFDREIFLAMPADPETERARRDPIPGEFREAWMARAAYRIRSRQENSPELSALRAASSRLRLFADELYPAAGVYGLAALMESERRSGLSEERRSAAFTHGYFRSGFGLGLGLGGAGPAVALDWRGSVYLGEMGDGSACSLKPDLRLEILSLSCGLGLAAGGEASLDSGLLAFDLQKILVPDAAEPPAFPLPGFALTLLDARLRLRPGSGGSCPWNLDATLAEAGFMLNLARSPRFRAHLNLRLGAAWRVAASEAGSAGFLDLPVRLEAALPAGGRDDGALRLALAWLPALGPGGMDASSWSVGATLQLGLARRGNAMLGMELALGDAPRCGLRISW